MRWRRSPGCGRCSTVAEAGETEPRVEGVIAAAIRDEDGLAYGGDADNAVVVFVSEHIGRRFRAGERVVITTAEFGSHG